MQNNVQTKIMMPVDHTSVQMHDKSVYV